MSQHDLPLPDYDGLPLGSIESRIRMLDVEGVEHVLEYEPQNADRVLVGGPRPLSAGVQTSSTCGIFEGWTGRRRGVTWTALTPSR